MLIYWTCFKHQNLQMCKLNVLNTAFLLYHSYLLHSNPRTPFLKNLPLFIDCSNKDHIQIYEKHFIPKYIYKFKNWGVLNIKRISLEMIGTKWQMVGISDFQVLEDPWWLTENKMHKKCKAQLQDAGNPFTDFFLYAAAQNAWSQMNDSRYFDISVTNPRGY